MPPELVPVIIQWGPLAVILFGILYRADQTVRALVPVIVQHFTKLAEGFDTMKLAVENQTKQTAIMSTLTERLEELGRDGSEDRAGIAEDAKNARIHAKNADDGVQEILRIIPQRLGDKEAV